MPNRDSCQLVHCCPSQLQRGAKGRLKGYGQEICRTYSAEPSGKNAEKWSFGAASEWPTCIYENDICVKTGSLWLSGCKSSKHMKGSAETHTGACLEHSRNSTGAQMAGAQMIRDQRRYEVLGNQTRVCSAIADTANKLAFTLNEKGRQWKIWGLV